MSSNNLSPSSNTEPILAEPTWRIGEVPKNFIDDQYLVGAFRNDTTILLRLAEAHLASERSDEAESCLNRCTEQRRSDEELTIRLMQARILSVKGQFADADALFLGLAARRRSEAPRFYHAESLRRAGRAAESRELLTDICKTYRRGTTVYRKREREWFVASRQLQKSIASQRR